MVRPQDFPENNAPAMPNSIAAPIIATTVNTPLNAANSEPSCPANDPIKSAPATNIIKSQAIPPSTQKNPKMEIPRGLDNLFISQISLLFTIPKNYQRTL